MSFHRTMNDTCRQTLPKMSAVVWLGMVLGALGAPPAATAKPQITFSSCSFGAAESGQVQYGLYWASGASSYSPDDVFMSISVYDGNGAEVSGPTDLNSGNPYAVAYTNTLSNPLGLSASYTPYAGGTATLNASADYNGVSCSGNATLLCPSPYGCCGGCSPCCGNSTSNYGMFTATSPEFEITEEKSQLQAGVYTVPLDITNKAGSVLTVHLVYSWFYSSGPDSPLVPIKFSDAFTNGVKQVFHRGTPVPLSTLVNSTTVTSDCHLKPTGVPAGSEIIVVVHARTPNTEAKPLRIEVTNNYQP